MKYLMPMLLQAAAAVKETEVWFTSLLHGQR
jgi:hypothetical protein